MPPKQQIRDVCFARANVLSQTGCSRVLVTAMAHPAKSTFVTFCTSNSHNTTTMVWCGSGVVRVVRGGGWSSGSAGRGNVTLSCALELKSDEAPLTDQIV
eukprot:3413504-Pleurochrysis_carterae.AAC.1